MKRYEELYIEAFKEETMEYIEGIFEEMRGYIEDHKYSFMVDGLESYSRNIFEMFDDLASIAGWSEGDEPYDQLEFFLVQVVDDMIEHCEKCFEERWANEEEEEEDEEE